MKSVKPGRAPSMMGGIGSIVVGVFGVIWTIFAASIGAHVVFCLFGVVFVVAAIAMAVYNFKNATSQNRYSVFDITEGNEEPDPLNQAFNDHADPQNAGHGARSAFCPYCGAKAQGDFEFCNVCGKKLP